MNALRLAARQPARALRQQRLASTISVVSHTSSETALPLSNVEAQWEKLAKDEQVSIYRQLETIQKKDWKTLTVDEKKAANPPPKTLTKEWQEASNEYAKENKLNPITGISSEGYKGKGFVVD